MPLLTCQEGHATSTVVLWVLNVVKNLRNEVLVCCVRKSCSANCRQRFQEGLQGTSYSLSKTWVYHGSFGVCAVAQLVTAPPRGCPPRGFKPGGRPQVLLASLLPLVIKVNTFCSTLLRPSLSPQNDGSNSWFTVLIVLTFFTLYPAPWAERMAVSKVWSTFSSPIPVHRKTK